MAAAADTPEQLAETTDASPGEDETSVRSLKSDGAKHDLVSAEEGDSSDTSTSTSPKLRARRAIVAAVAVVLAVAALAGSFGFNAYQSSRAEKQREVFVEVARQGAVNLSTVDWQRVDAEVQRILDSSTGAFHDDFQNRVQPFVAAVKQVQSRSVGTVSEAALESQSGNQAEVLVALKVKISTSAARDQPRRDWRMRVSVQSVGNDVKVSNVAFVP
jgi:Mce-associated membrane protein